VIQTAQARFVPVEFAQLPGWASDDLADAWAAWLRSCSAAAVRARPRMERACAASAQVASNNAAAQRAFFEQWFQPHQVQFADGKDSGLLTGYYEPLVKGSRTRSKTFDVPLYARPDDLLPQAVGDFQRSRRGANGQVLPYWSRSELEHGAGRASLRGKELLYVDDAVEALFLHVQGSGRIELADGSQVRAAFVDHNGHPYKSVGQWLIQRGELKADDASMQGIKSWARRHPQRVGEMLAANPRYVFFKEERIVNVSEGPRGALNVPLTAMRSIAVDSKAIELGLPLFIDSTEPLTDKPLRRLTFAQDVGGAISGAVRADLFWGTGLAAGEQAGRTKQPLKVYVLFPR
jgi:membrane-bound lytic murein transglycosylase A